MSEQDKPSQTVAPAPEAAPEGGALVREVVGVLATREDFEGAIQDLLAAGFTPSELSLLSSHDSYEAAVKPSQPLRDALAAVPGEFKYVPPLVASGAIFLAGGPLAVVAAALIGAAVGGVALTELVAEVTSAPDPADFARALEAGSIIVWVRVADTAAQGRAEGVLARHNAANIHLHESRRQPA